MRKGYRGSLGLFSFSSADPEGRFPANKKIHEHGILGREEFVRYRGSECNIDPTGVQLCDIVVILSYRLSCHPFEICIMTVCLVLIIALIVA